MTPPQPIGFTAHRCDEFQPGIPWRVALQQSPPPLPRPYSACNRGFRSPRKSQRTAHRDFSPCLTPGGHSILSSTQFGHFPPNPLISITIIISKSWHSETGRLGKIEIEGKKGGASRPFLVAHRTECLFEPLGL